MFEPFLSHWWNILGKWSNLRLDVFNLTDVFVLYGNFICSITAWIKPIYFPEDSINSAVAAILLTQRFSLQVNVFSTLEQVVLQLHLTAGFLLTVELYLKLFWGSVVKLEKWFGSKIPGKIADTDQYNVLLSLFDCVSCGSSLRPKDFYRVFFPITNKHTMWTKLKCIHMCVRLS